jgi:Dolichyl-phosphate-mannose-protein mannosyltransferase
VRTCGCLNQLLISTSGGALTRHIIPTQTSSPSRAHDPDKQKRSLNYRGVPETDLADLIDTDLDLSRVVADKTNTSRSRMADARATNVAAVPGRGSQDEGKAAFGSLGTITPRFSESQQAGLAVLTGLAEGAAPTGLVFRPLAPPAPPPSPSRSTGAQTRRGTSLAQKRRRLPRVPWPLLVILAVQAVLALRLIWSNTAYIDEATYLYAGSQELRHWLSGILVEDYQDFFSGAPALYPPIGAMANAIGGLTGARILSLLFMLGTSSLLYATTARLFGRQAAVLGTALFAALGVTQFLSAFATYDPMALFLLALASYLTVGRDNNGSLGAAGLSGIVAPLVLALANATKYATALWDPIVIGLVVCASVLARRSWRYGAGRAMSLVLG